MREDSRKIGVLITDGKSQDEIILSSQNLKNEGIELYAVGENWFHSQRNHICGAYRGQQTVGR